MYVAHAPSHVAGTCSNNATCASRTWLLHARGRAGYNLAGVLQASRACGVVIKTGSSKEVADSLDAAVRDDDPFFNKLVRIMATRCMTQAKYFSSGDCAPSEFLHYGLAAPMYTHFTSPIRRCAPCALKSSCCRPVGGHIAAPACRARW